MPVIGYEKAKNLMKQLDWKARVTMSNYILQSAELYHPNQPLVYTIRRDSAKKLISECKVCGHVNDATAILCYNHNTPYKVTLKIRKRSTKELYFQTSDLPHKIKNMFADIVCTEEFEAGNFMVEILPYNATTDQECIGDKYLSFLGNRTSFT